MWCIADKNTSNNCDIGRKSYARVLAISAANRTHVFLRYWPQIVRTCSCKSYARVLAISAVNRTHVFLQIVRTCSCEHVRTVCAYNKYGRKH